MNHFAKAQAAQKRAQALTDLAKKESRELTAEEANQFDAAMAEFETEMKLHNEEQARAKKLADASAALSDANRPRGPSVPDALEPAASDPRVDVGLPVLLSDRLFGFKSANHYFHDVLLLSSSNKQSRQLNAVEDALNSVRAASGAATFNGEDGGFVIAPPQISDDILARSAKTLPFLDRTQRRYVTGSSYIQRSLKDADKSSSAYRYGGIVVYRVDEGDSITSSKPKFRKDVFKLHKYAALAYASAEELAEAPAFGSSLVTNVANAFVGELTEDCLWGSGTAGALGILNSPAAVSITKESGQAANTVVAANIAKMFAAMWDQGSENAMWFYNGDLFVHLLGLVVDTGAGVTFPVFLPPGGYAGAPNGAILGRPAYKTDHMPALSSAGDISYVDPAAYVTVTKGAAIPEMAMSTHFKFDTDESAFRFVVHFDGRLPWDAAITARKGSTSTSPAVKLGAR